jgi:hypothetical protein
MPSPDGMEPRFLSSDDFHPELGYLLPTPRKRRQIRRVAMTASAAVVVAAISAFALAHREGGFGGRGDFVSAAAAAVAPTTDEMPAIAPVRPIAVTDVSGALPAPPFCQDLLGSFIDPQCRPGKPRKSRTARRASSQVVSIPIGRGASVARDETSSPTSKPRAQDKVVASTLALAKPSADAAPDPSASSANPSPKPSTKSAHKRKARSPDNGGLSAYAAAPWYGRNAYSSAVRPAPFGGGNWGRSW